MAKKKDEAEDGDEGEKGGGLGGKLKLVAMVLPTVLLVVGALYVFVLSPSKGGADTGKETSSSAKASATDEGEGEGEGEGASTVPKGVTPGKVLAVDPVTINLANGHYLKVGVGLQETSDAGEEVTGTKALDALISVFSGKTVTEIATKEGRDTAKKAVVKLLKKAYEKKVYDLYWTTFVIQ